MPERGGRGRDPDAGRCYEIVVRGEVSEQLLELCGGMTLRVQGDTTTIRGAVLDHSHLHGIVTTIFDDGLDLVSLRQLPDR
jgi:hypothetical protein